MVVFLCSDELYRITVSIWADRRSGVFPLPRIYPYKFPAVEPVILLNHLVFLVVIE